MGALAHMNMHQGNQGPPGGHKGGQFPPPQGGPMGAANLAAAAAFAASGGVPPHMITPELQRLQKQQMELQRLHMASMNHSAAGSFGHQSFDAKVNIFISQGA